MTDFLKGYAAGANDMEAGRLVTSGYCPHGNPVNRVCMQCEAEPGARRWWVCDRSHISRTKPEGHCTDPFCSAPMFEVRPWEAAHHGDANWIEHLSEKLAEQFERAETAEAKLAEVEKERDAISTQRGEERKARKAAEAIKADEVLAARTNWLARIESLEIERDSFRASMDRARELAEEIAKDPRTGQVDHWATAAAREIARILSGDE